jgi:hypothetical protein
MFEDESTESLRKKLTEYHARAEDKAAEPDLARDIQVARILDKAPNQISEADKALLRAGISEWEKTR